MKCKILDRPLLEELFSRPSDMKTLKVRKKVLQLECRGERNRANYSIADCLVWRKNEH